MRHCVLTNFWKRVKELPNGCWEWQGSTDLYGYGRMEVNRKRYGIHRLSYLLFVGDIPEGLQVDHECHNLDKSCDGGVTCRHRRCVNPDHLRVTTLKDNCNSSHSHKTCGPQKSHCTHGHAYTEENTYVGRNGARFCRTCARNKKRLYSSQDYKQGKRTSQ